VEKNLTFTIATLALGSRPKSGLARVWAKREAQESHFMVPGVQKSVREWTFILPRSSHFGNWSLGGLSNFQRAIVGAKTQWIEKFLI